MTKYVAFLRAINVGGHTVKMERLSGLFVSLGFARVETFIASGIVIFETAAKNSAALERALGYEVDTFVRTIQGTAEIEKRCPFRPKQKDDAVYVAFLHEQLDDAGKSALTAVKNKMNDFAVIDHEIYWLRLKRDDSIFLKNSLEKIVKTSTTLRNMTTVSKIVEKWGSI